MSDRRPGQVAQHCDRLASRLTSVAEALVTSSSAMSSLPPPRRPERLVKPPGTSDPTAGTVTQGETTLVSLLDRYVELCADVVSVAAQLGVRPDAGDLDGWAKANDPTLMPQPGTQSWRYMVASINRTVVGTVAATRHAWDDLHASRHTTGGGMQVLDEMRDMACSVHLDRLRHLSKRAGALHRQLTPGAKQPRLVYCVNHTDRLARYRRQQDDPVCEIGRASCRERVCHRV